MVSDHERGNSENNRHENLPEIPENSESSVSKTHLALDEEEKGEQIRSEQGSIHSQSSIDEIEILPPEPPNPVQLSITKSQSPSSLRSPIPVPPSERRGLLAKFALLAEVKNPYELENKKKWLITLIVALAACAGPMGSSIYYPALTDIGKAFNTSKNITNLSVSFYMLSMGIFPLWWSSFSETLGRRTIYIVSFAFFTIWNIASAESTSITMLIIMRILSGGSSAAVQSVGAGSIADIWESKERGKAMGVFYLGPLLGPLVAPIIGGVLTQYWGWRSTQWFQTIYGSVLLILIIFGLPETLGRKPKLVQTLPITTTDEKGGVHSLSRVSTRQSVKEKASRAAKIFKRCIIDPLSILLYLRFPAVILTVYLASITFGALYFLNISIQSTFSEAPYKYKVIIVGLLYIPNSLGYLVASYLGGVWVDHVMHRASRARGQYDTSGDPVLRPEDRMQENMWLAAILYPGALIWYGWAADRGVFWLVAMIPNFFFGIGSMLVFGTCTTILTEFMPKKSSSGVAVNNFVRNIFSCAAGILAQPIADAIGPGWLFTIIGTLCYVSALGVILAMKRYGSRWRVEMEKKLK